MMKTFVLQNGARNQKLKALVNGQFLLTEMQGAKKKIGIFWWPWNAYYKGVSILFWLLGGYRQMGQKLDRTTYSIKGQDMYLKSQSCAKVGLQCVD